MIEPVRVFLAEDNRFAVRAMKRHLKAWDRDFTLEIAMNGRAASDYVDSAETRPDVAILNLDMPEISGTELLRQIRSSDRLSELPCIVLTDPDDMDGREICAALRANAFLAKSAERDEFIGALERTIRSGY